MKSSARNVKLTTVDELFSTEESRQDAALEKVQVIALSELHPFPDHPFAVRDDDSMKDLVESIKESGMLSPLVARPRENRGYELISGHRRKHACELAGLETVSVIVRKMDDDTAIISMVDSNLQREQILPSEKAKAYKMKMEALKRQGKRTDLTSRQVGEKLELTPETSTSSGPKHKNTSVSRVASDVGESARQVHRYIRLTELSPSLQKMVDDKK